MLGFGVVGFGLGNLLQEPVAVDVVNEAVLEDAQRLVHPQPPHQRCALMPWLHRLRRHHHQPLRAQHYPVLDTLLQHNAVTNAFEEGLQHIVHPDAALHYAPMPWWHHLLRRHQPLHRK